MSKMRPPEAAKYLRISINTLAAWRSKKRGPKFYRVGRCIVYETDDLDTWVKSHGVKTIDSYLNGE